MNIGRMLSSSFNLDLVTTCPDSFSQEVRNQFEIHAPVRGDSLVTDIRVLRSYLAEQSPEVITQIGQVPVYGTLLSVLSDSDSTFVCRYSGDLFREHQLHSGLRRARLFIIKNGLGRIPLYTASQFITMGPREKERLVSRGVNPTAVRILPPPINLSRFEASREPDLEVPDGRLIVLFVGRVERLKGAKTLQRTIPKILDERPDLHFVFVGNQRHEFTFDPETRDHVTTVGRVPPRKIPGYHSLADLYVHPSLTEGVSRSILEALAARTPVIARDVGDLAFATSNIFRFEDDFVRMVRNFESLPVDDVERFSVNALEEEYCEFFERCIRNS